MKEFLLTGFLSACMLVAQPAPGTGSIEGHVFNSLTSAPLRKATVVLTADPTHTYLIRLIADTDAAGRFQFTGLPPGTYRLSGSRAGFLDRRARRAVSLGADEHATDSEIRLPPQGVISGRVLDEDDDPSPGAMVTIYKQAYRGGLKRWIGLSASIANEAGEYRFANLKPGTYILQADNRRPQAENQYRDPKLPYTGGMVYRPVYYQNGTTQQVAMPVDVGVGTELRGIDIHLFKVPWPKHFLVKGRVSGAQPSQTSIGLCLLPLDGTGCVSFINAAAPDYLFDVQVPADQYAILANVYSGGPAAFGSGSVSVTGDTTGIVVTMSPAPEVKGRVSLVEADAHVKLQGLTVILDSIPSDPQQQFGRSDGSGNFMFERPIRPGHYSLNVEPTSIPNGCYVREVKFGGQEIAPGDFEIGGSGQVEIILSNTAARIAGSVADADGKPFPTSSVTLIPTDGKSRPWKQEVDDDGNFQFTRLRPGKYKLFAWEEVDDDLWEDPAFRKKYEHRATEISVEPSGTQSTKLRLIAVDEMK